MSREKPILCLDFDGVIHRYDSGWKGAHVIADHATSGFFEWLERATRHFKIVVYSSRSKDPMATAAMLDWMLAERVRWLEQGGVSILATGDPLPVSFAHEKPAAFLTIDDRALTFTGNWADFGPEALLQFLPWNKKAPLT